VCGVKGHAWYCVYRANDRRDDALGSDGRLRSASATFTLLADNQPPVNKEDMQAPLLWPRSNRPK